MKQFFTIVLLLTFFIGCNKSNNDITQPGPDTLTLLAKKWTIVSDSVYNNNYAFPTGEYPIPGVFYGTPNDYYLFDMSNNVSVAENGITLKGKYKLLGNAKLLIDTTLSFYIADIKSIDENHAIFDWTLSNSRGGNYFRRLSLIK